MTGFIPVCGLLALYTRSLAAFSLSQAQSHSKNGFLFIHIFIFLACYRFFSALTGQATQGTLSRTV